MKLCHVKSIKPKQDTNQFIVKSYGPRLNYLQKGPTYQHYECTAHTSKHTPSLCIAQVSDLNQRKIEACTWSMCLLYLIALCLMH
jgi:hypothetical protein